MNDDEATTTTVDESWEERGSSISIFEPGIDIQPFRLTTNTGPNIGRQETSKERDRRLLRQHLETKKLPNLRNNFWRRFNHQTQLGSMCDENACEDHRTLQKDTKISTVTGSKAKKEIRNVRMTKMAQNKKKSSRKKPYKYPVNAMRIKRVRNTGTCVNCALQTVKWWTMTASIQPYTCGANRYAKFRSNRRFKPGD